MSDILRSIAQEVLRAAASGTPVAVATVIRAPARGRPPAGAKMLVRADGSRLGSLGRGALADAVAEDALAALTRTPRADIDAPFYAKDGARLHRLDAPPDAYQVLIEITGAPATLLIVGGGHVGQALAALASHAGFSVVVLDDRAAFANSERFPTTDRIICGDVMEELRRFPINASAYVVLVSRGHKQDELALREVVASGAAYVGMIGSQRRAGTVLTHLAREGYAREALARVRTPIGLDIGAETPQEIAVSILAELIAARRGGSGRKLSELRPPKIRP